MAPQKQLEGTRISGESYSVAQITAPPLKVVAGGRQCATRSTITPLKACSANFYRRIKRRLGRSFKRTHCKRPLVTAGKQVTHKLSRTKSSVPSLKRIPGPLCKQYSTSGHRQYNSGGLHKQRGRHEVRPTLCLTMENPDLVYQETRYTESPTHSGSAERGGRQAVQIRTDHSNRVVPPSAGIRSNMLQVAPTSNRPLCHQIQQQTTSLCVTLSGSHGLSSGCTQPTMGGSGPLCLSPNSHIGQGSGEVAGLPVQQNHSDRPRVAKHALVLDLVAMSSQIPLSLPKLPNLLTQPFSQTPHRNLTNLNLHAWLLEPQQSRSTVSLRRWQQELKLLKENQPDQSMKQNGPFLQSGASLIRWTSEHPL